MTHIRAKQTKQGIVRYIRSVHPKVNSGKPVTKEYPGIGSANSFRDELCRENNLPTQSNKYHWHLTEWLHKHTWDGARWLEDEAVIQ
jgi:hypothetical protein